jgi:hypothetical protein
MIWGNKRGGVQVSKASHVQGSGDMVKNGVQPDDTVYSCKELCSAGNVCVFR